MSHLFLVLALFIAQALGQAPAPDANCSAWLATPQGQNFTECEAGFPGLPMRTPDNNCLLTQNDFDLLCEDACFQTMVDAYDFILSTGTCLNLYEYYFGACRNDSDCTNTQLGPQVCLQGVCYTSCNTTDDCNPCNSETCETIGQALACQSNLTELNGTSTFRGNVYQLQATCSQNDQGDSCALLFSNITDLDLSNVTCSDFNSWGCCLGEMLTTMRYCAFQQFNEDAIYNCSNANLTCSPLQPALEFCAIGLNGTGNGTISSGVFSSSSSSISSNMTGSSSSISSNMTGSSSLSSHLSSHTGSGVGTGNTDNSAGTIVISWSLFLGLLLITPALS